MFRNVRETVPHRGSSRDPRGAERSCSRLILSRIRPIEVIGIHLIDDDPRPTINVRARQFIQKTGSSFSALLERGADYARGSRGGCAAREPASPRCALRAGFRTSLPEDRTGRALTILTDPPTVYPAVCLHPRREALGPCPFGPKGHMGEGWTDASFQCVCLSGIGILATLLVSLARFPDSVAEPMRGLLVFRRARIERNTRHPENDHCPSER